MGPTSATRRRRPFYGWVIVAGYFFSGMAGAGPTLWAFQVFVAPMEDELGWGRATLYSVLLFRTLLTAGLMVIMGRLMDKKGWPPVVMTSSAVLMTVSILGISQVHSYFQFFLTFVVIGGIGFAGAGGMLYQALVPKWFFRMRGRAIAMGSMGTAVAAFTYPLFAQFTIEAFGWRTAWLAMGISAFVLLVPVSIFIRRMPEDMGLLPDGDTPEQLAARQAQAAARAASTGGVVAAEEHSFTVRDALRSRTTWFIVAAGMLTAPTMMGLTATWVPYYVDIDISRRDAATALTMYGLFSMVSRFVWGYFLERHHVRKVAIVHSLLTVGTIVFLLQVTTAPVAMVYGGVTGLVLGGYLAIQPLIWATFFGRAHLGAIRGTFAPFNTAAGALGPFGIAAVRDLTGSYRSAFVALLVFWLFSASFMYLVRPLARPAQAPAQAPASSD